MSSTTTMDRLSHGLAKARTRLDRMRVDAGLLKLELREKKGEVLSELESAYEHTAQRLEKAARAAGDKVEAAREAADEAWQAFRRRYKKVTGADPAE